MLKNKKNQKLKHRLIKKQVILVMKKNQQWQKLQPRKIQLWNAINNLACLNSTTMQFMAQ